MNSMLTDAGELQSVLDSLSLIGCKVLSFDIVGRLKGLDHQSMIDYYNNMIAPEGGPYRKPGSRIFKDEISLDLGRTRMVSTDGPCVMRLDDGRTLTIRMLDISQASVAASTALAYERNKEVDATKIMSPIIGESISKITVAEMPESSCEHRYLPEAEYPNPFKYVRIDCEEHSLYVSYLTCAAMNNAEGLDVLDMTMGELAESISYYDELFD